VQTGGVISFASVDGLEEEEEGDGVIGYGLHVQGMPVGECAFVLHALDRPTDKAVNKFTPVCNVLVSSAHRHHLYTANTYCFATLLDHLFCYSYPEDVQSAFVRFDSSSRTTAELARSIDLEGVVLQRARLPLVPKMGALEAKIAKLDAKNAALTTNAETRTGKLARNGTPKRAQDAASK
jgi:hypothetical protein